jgi:signal transduction histidine kinase
MPNKHLSNEAMGYEGLNFENILRECLACGLFTIIQGKISLITPEATQLFGFSKSATRALKDLPAPLRALITEAQAGATISNHIIIFRTQSAEEISLSVTAASLGNKNNDTVVVLRNVSSVKKLEQKLQRLDRLASVGTLSASMAHEIKNALVPLRTFIDLLLEQNQDSELAGTVRREIARMDSIVSHLLKFAAPAKTAFSAVRLHEILEHSLRLAQHRVASKVIVFNKEFCAQPDMLKGDDHQLQQAFVNLLLNAIEAMGAEGTLTIRTELVSDDNVPQLHEGTSAAKLFRIQITDTGMGIAPENLQHVFSAFFTTKQNGTGLGLSVTRRIVEEHKGTIQVASQPGHGTTFTIFLPE